ncbi:MAG: M23 family metallopeptidase [Ruminiclostridium sp.]|nr:M23 family metallopeptidase [Ruminiclostridium sp.]
MNKGKTKTQTKKHLSIVFIPHSSNHVKVFRFSSFYGKFFAAFLLTAILVTGTVLLLRQVTKENSKLKQSLTELYSANAEQRKILDEKSDEIAQMKQSNEAYKKTIDEKTSEIIAKFNEITDKYIANQSTTKTSRSGERAPTGFSNEIGTLKEMIDGMNSLTSRANLVTLDLSEANAKIDKFFETVPTLIPVNGEYNNGFGYRRDPFTRRKTFHEGIDFSADKGTSIKASAGGKVTLAGRNGGYGLTVIIDHGRGLSTLYAHASKLLVKEGQTVKKGDIIAKVGSTGRSTGPHLHFEVLLYNTPVNPNAYIDIS